MNTIDPKIVSQMLEILSIPGASAQAGERLVHILHITTITNLSELKNAYTELKSAGKQSLADIALKTWEVRSAEAVSLVQNKESMSSIYPNLPPDGTASHAALVKLYGLLQEEEARPRPRSATSHERCLGAHQYQATVRSPADEPASGMVSV